MAHNVTRLNEDLQRLRPGATTPSRRFPGSPPPSLARFDRLPYNVITYGSVIGAARKVISGKRWARTVEGPMVDVGVDWDLLSIPPASSGRETLLPFPVGKPP
ncbi:hypothetical protein N7533_001983 [Penicillium manginii]|uniref:uncharacterized protein n=1 Tax=Penicillium manginii TaxID=203109 RepID=UPI002549384F|nr:uncharacterized protein N7533_001983 [Penicillium manginii]KAJ5763302.1 hypothetical protein N7533_001983 [Penicillium manginii]